VRRVDLGTGLEEPHDRLLEGQDLLLEGDDPLEDLGVAAEQLVVLLLAQVGLGRGMLEGQAIGLRRPVAGQQDERCRVGPPGC